MKKRKNQMYKTNKRKDISKYDIQEVYIRKPKKLKTKKERKYNYEEEY